ncbi:zinc-dependent metalloprotease [Fibrella forsythiae]|uniref:Zinc-dependent metalloprotease n=1 Tax=Fibrella forsythiae TaxID=2817061 RepID=A0ABS3JPT0_9BACT|nr:zinc-dependent metalloprotease [Fibrella forsythiae]MBO0952011.1 zinc-dependent metalloprotease [Fibrella forsythiae]
MHQHLSTVLRGMLLLGLAVPALAQNRRPDAPTSTSVISATTTPNTGSPTAAGPPRVAIKPYREVITRAAKTSKGLFTSHQIDDKYYFEIADSLLGREFMAITRIAKAPTGAGYGGELANRQVLRWERGPDRRLLLRVVSYINVGMAGGDTLPISQAVRNSNVEPIAAAFDVRAIRKDSSTVIDVTDFFRNDNQVVSLTPATKARYRILAAAADRSFIQTIKSYPINTEVRVTKTFNVNTTPTPPSPIPTPQQTVTLPGGNDAGAVTMEINTSMILLPKEPMRKRLFDSRVGFFANNYTVYDDNSQRTEDETFAVRWRLEAKNDADAERQKKGELIEPKKQIVYYIDPATPTKWRPFLKAGVADWQKAFEKAGWKNAIIAKDWNRTDTTLSLEDARYSVIRYFASDIENAYGPNVNDPRSGEIIESHIGWYHNVMNLLRKWYVVQGAAVDVRARKPKFDDELMGQLVRFVSSHEVGHTLGLRHNFGSSHATPVEKLRDKAFIAQNGHTASIMDYARFNYVAQPEDGITDLFPRIGTYDIWAIEWGYKPVYDTKDATADKLVLNTWVKSHEKDPRYWFGTEINPMDPRSQSEDLGDNAMKASEYGIKNLKRIMPNLTEWTKEEAEDYDKLREMYGEVVGQFRRYMGHVTKYVGGIYETPRTYDQTGMTVYEPTPKALQKEAMAFLNTQLFQTPTWILDPKIMPLVRADQGIDYIRTLQETTLNSLTDVGRLSRLIETGSGSLAKSGTPTYTLIEFMGDLQNGIFSELASGKAVDIYRRNLQKAYAEKLIAVLNTPASAGAGAAPFAGAGFRFNPGPVTDIRKSDIMSVVRGQLVSLQRSIAAAVPRQTDTMSKYHLADIQARIQNALDPKKG